MSLQIGQRLGEIVGDDAAVFQLGLDLLGGDLFGLTHYVEYLVGDTASASSAAFGTRTAATQSRESARLSPRVPCDEREIISRRAVRNSSICARAASFAAAASCSSRSLREFVQFVRAKV